MRQQRVEKVGRLLYSIKPSNPQAGPQALMREEALIGIGIARQLVSRQLSGIPSADVMWRVVACRGVRNSNQAFRT